MVKMQTNAQRAAGYRELQAEFIATGKTVLAEKAAKRAEGFEVLPTDGAVVAMAYLLYIHNWESFEQAERYFSILKEPAALLKFADGSGGIALLDRRPMSEGQRPFDAGSHEIRRNF